MSDSIHPSRDESGGNDRRFTYLEQGRHYEIDPETGCWNWLLYTLRGYGRCTPGGQATRVMWRQVGREIPDGHDLHHVCGNKACVNPAHLELVSHAEHLAAHKQAASSLTAAQVVAIRDRAARGETPVALGLEFGLSRHGINRIIWGINWRTVGGPVGREAPPRPCAHCGAEVAGHRGRRYCSDRCKQARNYRRQVESRAA